MVPQPPRLARRFGAARSAEQTFAKAVEKGIEIVVLDDEDPLVGMLLVVAADLTHDLQPQGCLPAPLFSEDDGSGRIVRAAEDLVPGRMIRCRQAVPLEDLVVLRVFLAEGVFFDAVMRQKLLNFHCRTSPSRRPLSEGCKPIGESL